MAEDSAGQQEPIRQGEAQRGQGHHLKRAGDARGGCQRPAQAREPIR